MKSLPPIDAKVRLNDLAHARLESGKKRARARDLIGTVIGSARAVKDMRAVVRWSSGLEEQVHPIYLEEAP